MKLDKISTGLVVTANIGVLIGLILVLFELRQNQESLDASVQLAISAAYQELSGRAVENRDFAEVMEKILWGPDDLDTPDRIRLTFWIQENLVLLFATYELRNKGVVSEATWIHNARMFGFFLEN